MSEQISLILKRKIDELAADGEIDPETRRNTLKEELQFYVLNFIYHHPEYNKWIMYGGSALRIIHGLDRMSVDLDFEISHAITEKFLEKLKEEIESHFISAYSAEADFLTIKITAGRSLILKFHVGEKLNLDNSSKWVHVKIDFNHFVAPKTVIERRPINRNQFSFVVLTYNMAALMASKIAAIFLREPRGIDKNMYEYKGRDIYDLLWYMSKNIVPDFDYLIAKHIDIRDPKALFDKLTIDILNYEKMDDCLKNDLAHLFENPSQFENWFRNWREDYLRLLNEYKIRKVTALGGGKSVRIHQHILQRIFSFMYTYNTEDGKFVRIVYTISDYWIYFNDWDATITDAPITVDEKFKDKIEFTSDGVSSRHESRDKLARYAVLFYQKTEAYFKKTNRIMLGDSITTKVIRMTADKLNPKEQILLNKSALLSCEFDDLLK